MFLGDTMFSPSVTTSLTSLVEACRQREHMYRQAAAKTNLRVTGHFLLESADQSRYFVDELSRLLLSMGIDVTDQENIDREEHITDCKAIMDWCESHEKCIQQMYESVLQNNIPAHIKSVLNSQYSQIVNSHNTFLF